MGIQRMDQLQDTPRKVQPMKCLVCHHDMVERHVTLDLRYRGELVVIEEAPAIVCENCDERVFTPDVTRRVQTLAQQRQKAARTIVGPVFSLDAR
jgi:YgiT-type zinc finger domain-containing protein